MGDTHADNTTAIPRTRRLRELAALFLKLGTFGFGGPAVHIGLMEDEVVRRRGWLSRDDFLDMLGITNLLPGPNSTEMAIHIGLRRAGVPGLIVAGVCFILPAAVLVTVLAWVYVTWKGVPAVGGILWGVKPVVIAVIGQALWRLGKAAVKSWWLAAVGIAAAAASVLGVHELIVLFAGAGLVLLTTAAGRRLGRDVPMLGLGGLLAFWQERAANGSETAAAGAGAAVGLAATGTAGAAAGVGLWPLFGVFLKIGSVIFGSGYVLLAFLQSDLVDRLHWITQEQLIDATAMGQVTPGPLFTAATFIGYLLAGVPGAVVATVGIFLPAFVLVGLSGPALRRLRQSALAGAFLDGLNVASLALMAVASFQLARAAVVDWPTALLAVASLVLLLRWKVNTVWLVALGAVAGAAGHWALGR